MRRLLISFYGAMILLLSAGCGILPVRYERAFSYTAPWNDYDRVVVRTRNGDVTLASAHVDQIRIDGTLRAEHITQYDVENYVDQIEIAYRDDELDPRVFLIELTVPAVLRNKAVGAEFHVLVPTPCEAKIHTSNGDVEVRKLKGGADLQTSNGRVFAENIVGPLDVRTSNGQIRAVYVEGGVTADTSNGRVVVDGVKGDCQLGTSNGMIHAGAVQGGVRAETSNGDIEVNARPGTDGQVILKTSNGDIDVDLPTDLTGTIELETSNGIVRIDTGMMMLARVSQSKRRFSADMNGGGIARIEARSSNGSVTLNCR